SADEPYVRRKAAESLGRLGKADAVPALLDALGKNSDRFLEHTVTYALIRIGDPTATRAALKAASPPVPPAGLIALDQMPGGELVRDEVLPLLETNDDALQQAVLEVVSRRPKWSASVKDLLAERLQQSKSPAAQQRALANALLALSSEA